MFPSEISKEKKKNAGVCRHLAAEFCYDATVHGILQARRLEWKWCLKDYSVIYMEFRKMVTMTLYARQQKRHRYIEQTFGLCGRRRGWDDLREQHGNMYMTVYETDRQPRLHA